MNLVCLFECLLLIFGPGIITLNKQQKRHISLHPGLVSLKSDLVLHVKSVRIELEGRMRALWDRKNTENTVERVRTLLHNGKVEIVSYGIIIYHHGRKGTLGRKVLKSTVQKILLRSERRLKKNRNPRQKMKGTPLSTILIATSEANPP